MSGDGRPVGPGALSVGMLRPCVLAHLVGGDTVYGYELHHWLLGVGVECDLGTVYRALNTMESEGLLHSTWERTTGGRSRRRYELSESGMDMIDAYVAPVEQLRHVAQTFLKMRRRTPGSSSVSSHVAPDQQESKAAQQRDPLAVSTRNTTSL